MNTTADGQLEYFARYGRTTDITHHAELVAGLPSDPAAAGEVVRGLLIHNWTAAMNGIETSPERDGMRTFGAAPTLHRILSLDPSPLDQRRSEEERLIGYCYHFAVLHCAFLRAAGVPSRTRCGFANYLDDGKWIDHWVVEYWDENQWRLNDPQIGLDELSHDDFRDGVRAWQLCRAGGADAADHGNGELWGWDELRGSLVNDLGALNKLEIGDWDWCQPLKVDPLDQPHPQIDAQLDVFAGLADRGQPIKELHAAFNSDSEIRPPEPIIERAERH
ncbi:MAG: transglutaminase-like domain-containing protein [Acidimicrobiales bacterium]